MKMTVIRFVIGTLVRVTKEVEQGQDVLEIRGSVDKIQTTA